MRLGLVAVLHEIHGSPLYGRAGVYKEIKGTWSKIYTCELTGMFALCDMRQKLKFQNHTHGKKEGASSITGVHVDLQSPTSSVTGGLRVGGALESTSGRPGRQS